MTGPGTDVITGTGPGPRPGPVVVTGAWHRVVLIAALATLLVGVGIVDRLVARPAAPEAPAAGSLSALGVTPGPGTESTAWYCAGGTGAQGGAPATIVLTNTSARAVGGTLTVVAPPVSGASSPVPWAAAHSTAVHVPPDGQVAVGADQLGTAAAVAVAVVLDGGGVAVSEAVSSPLGWSMAPCASSMAADWYFAHGATAQGSGLTLSLFNPGATDATVDVSLVSATAGFLAPAAYQGIDIAPGSLVTENVGDHAPDDAALATEVSALSGGVVATELESVGTPGNGGISLLAGSRQPASRWVFAQNTDLTGGRVAFHVLNPTTRPAVVSVAIGLPRGAAAEPLTLRVPPQAVATLVAEDQTRIPANLAYSAVFTSRGAPVVVVRQVTSPAGVPAPVPEDGDVPGVPGGGTRWVLPAVVAPGTGAWALAVVDLGPRPAHIRVTTPGGRALPGQATRRVVPGTPLVIGPNPGPPLATSPVGVTSDEPVALELDALPVAGPGVVVVPAFTGRPTP